VGPDRGQDGDMTAGPYLLPQRQPADAPDAVDLHPPKVEYFDVPAMTNTDPKGFVREVDEYRIEPFGLYMARPVVGRPKVAYLESWLLPQLGLRISDWHFQPGHERDQDFYLDIARIEPGPEVWRATDLYLDIVLRTGRDLDVLDTDELLAAMGAGLIDRYSGQRAFETTYLVIEELAKHGYDVAAWLGDLGIELTWRRK
jgi:uncharacterized protein